MLIQLIRCEKMKCKGTLIWPAFFLIPVIPAMIAGYIRRVKCDTL